MSDVNHGSATLGSIAGSASNKLMAQIGHVSFSRHDGVGSVQISSPLTSEAALKLEGFLRDLIAEDQPKLQAMEREARDRAMSEQYRNANAGALVPGLAGVTRNADWRDY